MDGGPETDERYRSLATASRSERARVFAAGTAPDVAALDGWEFRGWNTSWITGVLGARKFVKAFFGGDRAEGEPYGCNSRAEQNGLDGDWLPKPSEAEPGNAGGAGARRRRASTK